MKRIVLIIAVAAAVGCARPVYVSKSDLAGAWMHGAVSQIRETLSSGGIVETYTEVNYNRAGNVTVQSVFAGPERTPISREEYTYDPSGERVEKYVERNLVKSTFSTVYYTYDEAGRMVAQGNKLWGPARTEFTYDRRGYPATETGFSSDNKVTTKTRNRYDRFGRLRVTRSIEGGDPRRTYAYHPNGVVARISIGRTATDRYNERGNLAASTAIIRLSKLRGTKLRTTGHYPMTLTAEYEYDSRGNWIRRVQYYKDSIQSVALREIDYFGEGGR